MQHSIKRNTPAVIESLSMASENAYTLCIISARSSMERGIRMAKTALVAGATGLIGKEVVGLLLANPDYERVITLVRKPLDIQHEKLVQQVTDFDHLEEVSGHILEAEDVFCTLGTTIKVAKSKEAFRKVDYEYPVRLAQLAKQCGTKRFLIVTAMGADPHSRIFYNQVKGQAEEQIKRVGLASLHIFRPSLLLGDRTEVRLGEKIGSILGKLSSWAMIGGLRKYRPIPSKVVAEAMVHAAQSQSKGQQVYLSDEIVRGSGTSINQVR
jgi:uncharacterized protein YbjT (DUF2867 family)